MGYRYSSDNITWGAWSAFATSTAAPFSAIFFYPQGQGYYEFYSRATDSNNNIEPAPAAAQAATHYTATPAYATEAIVTLGNLTTTYDGTAKFATVSTVPPGLTSNVTYNGGSSIPVSPGTYTVSATVTQPGYTGSASATLTIGKTTATVALVPLTFTNDGSPKSVTATTNPAGLAVTVNYNGSTTAPTAAGTYTVVATINVPYYQGTTTASMTISDAGNGAAPVPTLGIWGLITAAALLGGVSLRRSTQKR